MYKRQTSYAYFDMTLRALIMNLATIYLNFKDLCAPCGNGDLLIILGWIVRFWYQIIAVLDDWHEESGAEGTAVTNLLKLQTGCFECE